MVKFEDMVGINDFMVLETLWSANEGEMSFESIKVSR